MASFAVMNFTGASTYTSLSGVLREMRFAVPAQIAAAVAGFGLGLGGFRTRRRQPFDFRSARERSSLKSSGSSSPTESRTSDGVSPTAACSSRGMSAWVIVDGCVTRIRPRRGFPRAGSSPARSGSAGTAAFPSSVRRR